MIKIFARKKSWDGKESTEIKASSICEETVENYRLLKSNDPKSEYEIRGYVSIREKEKEINLSFQADGMSSCGSIDVTSVTFDYVPKIILDEFLSSEDKQSTVLIQIMKKMGFPADDVRKCDRLQRLGIGPVPDLTHRDGKPFLMVLMSRPALLTNGEPVYENFEVEYHFSEEK